MWSIRLGKGGGGLWGVGGSFVKPLGKKTRQRQTRNCTTSAVSETADTGNHPDFLWNSVGVCLCRVFFPYGLQAHRPSHSPRRPSPAVRCNPPQKFPPTKLPITEARLFWILPHISRIFCTMYGNRRSRSRGGRIRTGTCVRLPPWQDHIHRPRLFLESPDMLRL